MAQKPQTLIRSLGLARKTRVDARQSEASGASQQQIHTFKEQPADSDNEASRSPLSKIESVRFRVVKEQNVRKKAAYSLVEAESAKMKAELGQIDARVATACVADQRVTPAQQFLRTASDLQKLSEKQRGESGVSALLVVASAATQKLADKTGFHHSSCAVCCCDTETRARQTSAKRGTTDLDVTQAAEHLEMRAESIGFDITQLDDQTRAQDLHDRSRLGQQMRTGLHSQNRLLAAVWSPPWIPAPCRAASRRRCGVLAAGASPRTDRFELVFSRPPQPPHPTTWALKV